MRILLILVFLTFIGCGTDTPNVSTWSDCPAGTVSVPPNCEIVKK